MGAMRQQQCLSTCSKEKAKTNKQLINGAVYSNGVCTCVEGLISGRVDSGSSTCVFEGEKVKCKF